jgi:hypothetical protein
MKKILLLTFTLLSGSILPAQSNKNDLKKLELKGQVKTLLEYETSFINEKIYKRDSIYHYFDKFGNITSKVLYKSNLSGEKRSDFARETIFTSKYNEKNQRTEVIKKCYDSEFDNKITNKYDPKGNLIEEKYEFEELNGEYRSQAHTYKYDSNGKMIEKYIIDNIDGEGTHYLAKYDSLGNKIEEGYPHDKHEYTYKNGKMTSKKNLLEDGKIRYECILEIDSNGNETEVKYRYPNGEPDVIFKYKFEYDGNSNWITKIMYNSEDVLISEKKRIIYYFD